MEDAILDIGGDPELADEMLARCADLSSGQRGMMLSPRSWRTLIKPHLARVFETGRKRGLPVAYHCCGGLRPIIGDLIEIGMDVLNPVVHLPRHGPAGIEA
jgi:hypothetical protein